MSAPRGARGTGSAVFLDRDDTLLLDRHYMCDPEQVELLPGVHEALLSLGRAGLRLVVVSNQSGVGRGWFTRAQVDAIEQRMCALLPGVLFAGFEYCFHRPDERCACRKPSPLMLQRAAARLHLDLGQSVMVGDSPKDIDAGRAAGCLTVQVQTGQDQPLSPWAHHQAPDLRAAAAWILANIPVVPR